MLWDVEINRNDGNPPMRKQWEGDDHADVWQSVTDELRGHIKSLGMAAVVRENTPWIPPVTMTVMPAIAPEAAGYAEAVSHG